MIDFSNFDSLITMTMYFNNEATCRQAIVETRWGVGENHKICDHGQLQFVVDGEVYTNNIEGLWSHFRRMITGCYHDVSDEHLQSYIDEAVYRWNTRKASESERFSDMFNKSIGLIVTWSELKLCKVA